MVFVVYGPSLYLEAAGIASYRTVLSFSAVGAYFYDENDEYMLSRGGFFVLCVAGFTARLFLRVDSLAFVVVFTGVGMLGLFYS